MLRLLGRCDVCPPYPRRDACHTAEFEHSISCCARLRAEDDECFCHAFHGIVNNLHAKGFPFAFDVAHVYLALCDEVADVCGLSDGAHDDGVLCCGGQGLVFCECFPCDGFEVGEEAVGYCGHHFSIVGIVGQDGFVGGFLSGNGEASVNWCGDDFQVFGHGCEGEEHKQHGKE